MTTWKYTDQSRRVVVSADGCQSCLTTALPADTDILPPDPVIITLDAYKDAIEAMEHDYAVALDYISFDRLLSHVNSPDPVWKSDGERAWAWKTAIDRTAYEILGAVQSGKRPLPSIPEFIALLPTPPTPTSTP